MAAVDPAHLVGAGGAAGALLRYWVGEYVEVRGFPASTLAVNVAGTFALALVAFVGLDHRWVLLVGVGACGSFTTFSSFSVATVRLYERGARGRAAAFAAGNLVLAALAAGLAWLVAAAV